MHIAFHRGSVVLWLKMVSLSWTQTQVLCNLYDLENILHLKKNLHLLQFFFFM